MTPATWAIAQAISPPAGSAATHPAATVAGALPGPGRPSMDSPHAVHAPGPGTPWQQHAPDRHAGHNPALWGAIWLDYSYEVGSLAAYCGIGGEW